MLELCWIWEDMTMEVSEVRSGIYMQVPEIAWFNL
jgi:hypothetical protein